MSEKKWFTISLFFIWLLIVPPGIGYFLVTQMPESVDIVYLMLFILFGVCTALFPIKRNGQPIALVMWATLPAFLMYGIAIEALLQAGVPMKEHAITKGVATASLPYRFQEIAKGVFIDGAHNPAAAKMLAETISLELPGEKVDFVIGMLKTKDMKHTIDELIPVAASFTFVTFPHPQAASAEELMDSCQYNIKRVTKIDDDTIILRKGNDRKRIVAGSLYLISGLLN